MKKIVKIGVGLLVFFTLPSILFFSFIYFKYNEPLPNAKYDDSTQLMVDTIKSFINYEHFSKTDYISWTFKKRHHFKWYKNKSVCEVYWKNIKVKLDLNNQKNSLVYINENLIDNSESKTYIKKAIKLFNNDSFWLVAPFKIEDEGTVLKTTVIDNKKALMVTYTKGGTTPGDTYVWLFDEKGNPKSFKMWVDLIPIGGLEASWNDWILTDSKIKLPTVHKIGPLELEIDQIITKVSY